MEVYIDVRTGERRGATRVWLRSFYAICSLATGQDVVQPWSESRTAAIHTAKQLGYTVVTKNG